ncbi:hypothetical protein AMTR_s00110p00119620 [Amborella trichopoda]|uniref:Uncharacterized protein n=1 Tax=Amborella trichopoda TaxID=13333 RepID=W1NXF3_AMBTC|nr:hypothetical protein AMTR_s00110p00119620 [Amborella trichopoda]
MLRDDKISEFLGLLGNRSVIQLAPNTPLIDRSHFPWLCIGDTTEQKAIYRYFCQLINSLDGLEFIYVSFGSFTLFDKRQLHELALALENLGRPFLWVARPDLIDKAGAAYPEGFLDRVGAHGKVALELEGNKDGIFSKEEMRGKVEELLGDQAIRERALKLKEQAIYSVTEGTSRKNLTSFIEAMKRQA